MVGIRLLLVVAVALGVIGLLDALWATVRHPERSRPPIDPWWSLRSDETDHVDPYLLAFAAGVMPGR